MTAPADITPSVALPGPRGLGTFLVYLVAPVFGAVAGGCLYDGLLRPALPAAPEKGESL